MADIIENAERVEGYIAGMDRRASEQDGRTRDAVERCLERICEAAQLLGQQADVLMPGQPRSDIRGMGNRLRHAYDRVNLDIVWNTSRDRLRYWWRKRGKHWLGYSTDQAKKPSGEDGSVAKSTFGLYSQFQLSIHKLVS